MEYPINDLLADSAALNNIHTPVFFRLNKDADQKAFEELLESGKVTYIGDEIIGQLKELIKSEHPSVRLKPDEYEKLITERLNGKDSNAYGVWVYYPWSGRLIHILDETEFIAVRTNRNQYKITRAERDLLGSKKIGIVGLSVGQSIALTMATERICGEMRLADFDDAELSNLNRLRTGIYNLGIKKTIIAAREIAELDPFIKVILFHEGLTETNMDQFFTDGGKLDLFIEVCDGLDIKLQSRFRARELEIPVVMDTNDRGMLDVERFDLEPQRPVLHGLVGDIDPHKIKDLPMDEKIPLILKMVGIESISTRLKTSMMEIDQTITTWPQLASSVTLGGALTTDVSRRILLDQFHDSGRYYIDFDQLIKDENLPIKKVPEAYLPPAELTREDMLGIIQRLQLSTAATPVEKHAIEAIVAAGIAAPSGGNAQPWKFLYKGNRLYIFHDVHFSHSLLDHRNLGSYLAIGAAVENITIKSAAFGFDVASTDFPIASDKRLVAVLTFEKKQQQETYAQLANGLTIRHTNRINTIKPVLPPATFDRLQKSISDYPGAELLLISDEQQMKALGELLATAEMLRILHPRGHYDTFTNELRWTKEENEEKRDGLDVATLGVSLNELVALKVAEDSSAIEALRKIRGGAAFKKMVNKAVGNSAALGIITMPAYTETDFLKGGRAVERVWIEANLLELSFQPLTQLVFLLARFRDYNGQGLDMDAEFLQDLERLQVQFDNLFPQLKEKQPVFIFRLGEASDAVKSLRRPIGSSFYYFGE